MMRLFRNRDRQSPRAAFRPGRIGVFVVVALCLAGAAVAIALRYRPQRPVPQSLGGREISPEECERLRPEVTVFCGNCHAPPSPSGFPKVAWLDEVRRGFEFYHKSGRDDLDPPPVDQVVAFYRSQAPDEIVVAPAKDAGSPPPVRFRTKRALVNGGGRGQPPGVADIRWVQIAKDAEPVLLFCDMRSGQVGTAKIESHEIHVSTLAKLENPAHAVPVDLDSDGQLDLVVADLGSFLPADHENGRVVWLRRVAQGGYEPVVLQSGLGRVADVEPGDFDGDGDPDLVVAEFGWHVTGRILMLENKSPSPKAPEFAMQVVDGRHGTIHVPVVDLNDDGMPDFIALISQEHETVEAFLNEGEKRFRHTPVFEAGEPAFGSSGIELVDLDGDGDLDILHTNGDTFDSFYVKPYHGIRWLENQGDEVFEPHPLAEMTGVHRALAGDIDGDGDLDIVACALVPETLRSRQPRSDFDALMWLEQTAKGVFARHSIARGECRHAAMTLGDFDGDGDLDIAVGGFAENLTTPAITIWWNERPDSSE